MKVLYGSYYKIVDKDSEQNGAVGMAKVPIRKFIEIACDGRMNPEEFDMNVHVALQLLNGSIVLAFKDRIKYMNDRQVFLLKQRMKKSGA